MALQVTFSEPFPLDVLQRILQVGIEEDILDIPDIKNFKLVSRSFSRAVSKNSDSVWIVVAKKTNSYLAKRFIEIKNERLIAKEKSVYVFDLLKNNIFDEIHRAKEASPLLKKWVMEEIFINNITFVKIRELKRKILREGGYLLIDREDSV
ncbi:MAG: hypothetical protein K940chlam5_01311 [Candidatus Anoxychlamydiales bacterium]|nr:hypothetical protein [Candidatus Anoxychlamydiales bacterium]